MFRLFASLALAVACALAGPAQAQWRRAESDRFVVYSQQNEPTIRRYVRNLEIYDYVLRLRMGLPLNEPPGRKLPIYLVQNRAGLEMINPGTGENVAGTYFPRGEDIFAAAIQDGDQDTLLHEYFHHFSFQLETSTYPGWLIEGLAEYFMTADITPDYVVIGRFNEARQSWIANARWIPLEELVTKPYYEVQGAENRATYYPIAWLLTHWFMSDEARRRQLDAYLRDIRANGNSVEAMERATGMTMQQIRNALRGYRRLLLTQYRDGLPDPEITITRLPPSANDLLLIGQRLKIGVPEDERENTAALVRRLAARHPDDPFAMLQLGHAELHFGDADEGEAVLTRPLEIEPDNIEALQLMGARHTTLAEENPDQERELLAEARRYLARAYTIDNNHYYTLFLLAQARVGAPGYPTENDLTTWDLAFRNAPQLPAIRLGYGQALILSEEKDEAIHVLEPLAGAPHSGGAAAAARFMIENVRSGGRALTEAEVNAAEQAGEQAEPAEPAGGEAAPSEPSPEEPDA